MTAASAIRQALWGELRVRDMPASVPELAAALGTSCADIAWRLSRWTSGGHLHKTSPEGGGDRTRYLMADGARRLSGPPAASTARQGREAMWRAMRVLRRFDLPRLVMAAEVSEASAKVYVSALVRAGLLRCELRGNAAIGLRSIYALAGPQGPRPPVVSQQREAGRTVASVLDPNTGTSRIITGQRLASPLF